MHLDCTRPNFSELLFEAVGCYGAARRLRALGPCFALLRNAMVNAADWRTCSASARLMMGTLSSSISCLAYASTLSAPLGQLAALGCCLWCAGSRAGSLFSEAGSRGREVGLVDQANTGVELAIWGFREDSVSVVLKG